MTRRLQDGRIIIEFGRPDKVVTIWSEERPELRYFTMLLNIDHEPWMSVDTM